MTPSPSFSNAARAAIQFALETSDSLTFLRAWEAGDFPEIRLEWPEAPEAVFLGADPTLPAVTRSLDEQQDERKACSAIRFALETEEGEAFLRAWVKGNVPVMRREWPEVPESLLDGVREDTLLPRLHMR